MTEYINKQALLAEYDCVHVGPPGGARKLIEEAPTADVAPVVHGRWVLIETGYGAKIYECSECKDDDYWKRHFAGGFEHYCPNCGARMGDS